MDLGAHLWTIVPRVRHALRPVPSPPGEPFALAVEDPRVGQVALSGFLRHRPGSDELLLLVHGLGGCAESLYMLRAAHAAEAAGLSCLRLNLRGSDRAGEDFYHAGLTSDLHAALASPELARYRRIYVLGYSLGGHIVLRLATEPGDPRLAAVAAVCAPVDLGLSATAFDRPEVWLYRRYVLASLVEIYTAIAARRPVPVPVAQVARIRRMREWDDRVVAPRHGFAGADDYYARASVAPQLDRLRVPALLIAAERDPMILASTIRPSLGRAGSLLSVRWVQKGGHLGFPEALDLGLEADAGDTGDAGRNGAAREGLEPQLLRWLLGAAARSAAA